MQQKKPTTPAGKSKPANKPASKPVQAKPGSGSGGKAKPSSPATPKR